MTLTPDRVRAVVFDRAPLGRRGYDEDQVDDFLDLVESALRGEADLSAEDVRSAVFDSGSRLRRGYDEEQVDTFLDDVVAALAAPRVAAGEPGVEERRSVPQETDVPFLPLPPAPPGIRGYRPNDVARLARLLSMAIEDPSQAPTAAQLSQVRMTLTYFVGQGYDPRPVDALMRAWMDELHRRES